MLLGLGASLPALALGIAPARGLLIIDPVPGRQPTYHIGRGRVYVRSDVGDDWEPLGVHSHMEIRCLD